MRLIKNIHFLKFFFNAGDFLCVAKMDTERPAKYHELENHQHTSYKNP